MTKGRRRFWEAVMTLGFGAVLVGFVSAIWFQTEWGVPVGVSGQLLFVIGQGVIYRADRRARNEAAQADSQAGAPPRSES